MERRGGKMREEESEEEERGEEGRRIGGRGSRNGLFITTISKD